MTSTMMYPRPGTAYPICMYICGSSALLHCASWEAGFSRKFLLLQNNISRNNMPPLRLPVIWFPMGAFCCISRSSVPYFHVCDNLLQECYRNDRYCLPSFTGRHTPPPGPRPPGYHIPGATLPRRQCPSRSSHSVSPGWTARPQSRSGK